MDTQEKNMQHLDEQVATDFYDKQRMCSYGF